MRLKSVQHVACYLSGGVDSAVAALLMKGKGNFVTGLFLRNKYEEDDIVQSRYEKACKTCDVLKIPFKEVTLNDDQWGTFVSPLLAEYRQGKNPSLDVLYNRHIIFGALFDKAVNDVGADYVVSGHYARTTAGEKIDKWTRYLGNKLFKAVDQLEDQSYQLSLVPQACLQKAYFPLGDFTRDVVSTIVAASELKHLFDKKDIMSSGQVKEEQLFRSLEKIRARRLCLLPSTVKPVNMLPVPFYGQTELLDRLQIELPETTGKFYDLENGIELGNHDGLHLWHIGKTVQIDGKAFIVAEKTQDRNCIKLVQDPNHPSLLTDRLFMSLLLWSHEIPHNFFEKQMMDAELRLNCHQAPSKCSLTLGSRGVYYSYDHVIVSSLRPFRNAIPGHVTAFYHGEECIGGAKILRAGPSNYVLNYKKHRKSGYSSRFKNYPGNSSPA